VDSKVKTELELITERAARISEMASAIWETEHEDDVDDVLRNASGVLQVLVEYLERVP
jgi:hypothetical protein